MSPLPTHIPHTPHIQTTHCTQTSAHITCPTPPACSQRTTHTAYTHTQTHHTHHPTRHTEHPHGAHPLHTHHTSTAHPAHIIHPHTTHTSPLPHTAYHTHRYKHTCSRQTPTHITYPPHTCTHTPRTYHTLHTCTHRTPPTRIPTPIQTHMPLHHTHTPYTNTCI